MFRFIAEFAREPDAFLGFLALGMTMGQWLCLPMIAAGIGALRVESTLDPVLGAVLPVFGLVASRLPRRPLRAGQRQASSAALNQFVYAFALPAMLFVAVYRGSLEEILSGCRSSPRSSSPRSARRPSASCLALSRRQSPAESTLRALNASFANTGYLGIPLVTVAYGERAALPAALATVATNIVPSPLADRLPRAVRNPQRPAACAARCPGRAQPADLADRAGDPAGGS